MPDRVIRDELLDSERWLSLPSDTDRLAFIGLLLRCDDFGNLEGGLRRLFRFLHTITQVKTEEAAATALLRLTDSDMLRHYAIDGREFYHLPRFRPHRQYLVRKYPPSPWDSERELGKDQRVINRGLAKDQTLTKNIATTSIPRSNDVAQGVGVGVGVGVGERLTRARESIVDNFVDNAPNNASQPRAKERKSKSKPPALLPRPGESTEQFRIRVLQSKGAS